MQAKVHQSQHFPVSVTHNYDNGLGFGQGSVAGVYNQYPKGGFHRPGAPLPEISRLARHQFNLKGCNKSYRCHYDPDALMNTHDLYDITRETPTLTSGTSGMDMINTPLDFEKDYDRENDLKKVFNIFNIVIIAIVLFFVFGRNRF